MISYPTFMPLSQLFGIDIDMSLFVAISHCCVLVGLSPMYVNLYFSQPLWQNGSKPSPAMQLKVQFILRPRTWPAYLLAGIRIYFR